MSIDTLTAKIIENGGANASMGSQTSRELDDAFRMSKGVPPRSKTPSIPSKGETLQKSAVSASQKPSRANGGAVTTTKAKKPLRKQMAKPEKKQPIDIGDPVVIGSQTSPFYKKKGTVVAIYSKLKMARVNVLVDSVESDQHKAGQFQTVDVKLSALFRPGEVLPKRKIKHVLKIENL